MIQDKLKKVIRDVPDFPKPGINFKDISTIMLDPVISAEVLDHLVDLYKDKGITKIAGIESRGFLFGYPLAIRLGVPFVLIRKKGKLPAKTIGCDYALEYGTDRIEVHSDAILEGENILLIDDLIATGGTAEAAITLIRRCGGVVVECAFVVDLPELGGRKRLEALGATVFSLTEFEGH